MARSNNAASDRRERDVPEVLSEVEKAAAAKRAAEDKEAADFCKAENAKRSDKEIGFRWFSGRTRGKGSQVVKWEAFDTSIPSTVPTKMDQFIAVTGKSQESQLVETLVIGENEMRYTAASDPIAEYVEDQWPAEVQANFRLVVRNYARGLDQTIEQAVNIIKPGFVKQYGGSDVPVAEVVAQKRR